jgi:hypothetical protein
VQCDRRACRVRVRREDDPLDRRLLAFHARRICSRARRPERGMPVTFASDSSLVATGSLFSFMPPKTSTRPLMRRIADG